MANIHVQSIVDGILGTGPGLTGSSVTAKPTFRISSAAARADLISRLLMIENRLKEAGCYFSATIDPFSIRLEFYPFSGTRTIIGLTHLEKDVLSQYLTMAGFRVRTQFDPRYQTFSLKLALKE